MPKLDLRSIHMQREVQSDQEEEDSDEEEGSYYEEVEDDQMDSAQRKE